MFGYVMRRLLQMVPVLFGVTLIVFVLLRMTGDPVTLMLGEDATPDQIAVMRQRYGLDRPVIEQYLRYIGNILQGDFGLSLRYVGQPALDVVLERLPATALLTAVALSFAVAVSLPAGIISALFQGRVPDHIASFVSVLGQAMPNFWIGIMLILIVSLGLGWLPVSGRDAPLAFVLPGITMGAGLAAVLTRLLRSSLIDVMGQDYIRTAHAKGLPPGNVLRRHALRNAVLSYLTVIGVDFSYLMAGAVVTEQVFAWPGIGLLTIHAINARDFAVVQTIVILSAVIVMVVNLLVDIAYALIDPRIGYGKTRKR